MDLCCSNYPTSQEKTILRPKLELLTLTEVDLIHERIEHKPASYNDDIFRDVGHLFNGQVAHPP